MCERAKWLLTQSLHWGLSKWLCESSLLIMMMGMGLASLA
jgi:hypothetical protein